MQTGLNEKKLREIYDRYRIFGCFLGWEEFKDKVTKAYLELIKVAKRRGTINYSELGIGKLGISPDWLYPKIGWIVGACSEYEWKKGRPFISAIVVNKETNRPGKGFLGLGGIPAHLRISIGVSESGSLITTTPEQDEFW